jgi:hypothetical protein
MKWREWMRTQVRQGWLQTANGSRRIISGRKNDDFTLKKLLSHEPQGNTTYITNKAAERCYYDPSNRWIANRALRVEPVHQIHDALVLQWFKREREYALEAMKRWFDIELVIAGIKIKIPSEGGWGTSWGELPNEIKD